MRGNIFLCLLTTVFVGGGCAWRSADADPDAGSQSGNTLPPAMDHPTVSASQTPPPVKTASVKPVESARTPQKPTPEKPLVRQADASPETPRLPPAKSRTGEPRPPVPSSVHAPARPRHSPDSYRLIWQAFAGLTPQEQQKLMEIQRQNPEQFQAVMREKAAQLYAKRLARKQELDALVQKYRTCGDPREKSRIKAELRQKLSEDFSRRLQDSRRDLEANRNRLARMETELKRRENNRDAIVDAILADCLAGKKPPIPAKK